MERLKRLAAVERIDVVDFQVSGALEPYPQLSWEMCMEQMWLLAPTGRLYGGAQAAVHAVGTRRMNWLLLWLYYVPGLRQLADWTYGRIAARRYAIAGSVIAEEGCEGSCSLHFPDPSEGAAVEVPEPEPKR